MHALLHQCLLCYTIALLHHCSALLHHSSATPLMLCYTNACSAMPMLALLHHCSATSMLCYITALLHHCWTAKPMHALLRQCLLCYTNALLYHCSANSFLYHACSTGTLNVHKGPLVTLNAFLTSDSDSDDDKLWWS